MSGRGSGGQSSVHAPVMVAEMLTALSPAAGEPYIDVTFGAGGYSRAILAAAHCRLAAIDRDPEAVARGRQLEIDSAGRFQILQARFSEMENALASAGVRSADGVAFDLGVSSPQLDDGRRGFSFAIDGPLDMRMSKSGAGAAEFVNTADEGTLASVISRYGEERHARRIARAIVRARSQRSIARTTDLAEIVTGAVPYASARRSKIHPATRTFQALRIHINNELDELRQGLAAAERLLVEQGRLVVVAFHSLEDGIVKEFLGRRSGRTPGTTRYRPEPTLPDPTFELPFRRPHRPQESEVAANPRARSARLRAGIRTAAPAWPAEALT